MLSDEELVARTSLVPIVDQPTRGANTLDTVVARRRDVDLRLGAVLRLCQSRDVDCEERPQSSRRLQCDPQSDTVEGQAAASVH